MHNCNANKNMGEIHRGCLWGNYFMRRKFSEGRLKISATCFERHLDFQNTKKFSLICNVKILKNAFELWKQQLQI